MIKKLALIIGFIICLSSCGKDYVYRIEVSDFKEYCREAYMWDECDENGTPFESKEDYVAWVFEIPLSVAKGCLVVRVDYGYSDVDKFLTKNFKCIASDHERIKDTDGRIVKD